MGVGDGSASFLSPPQYLTSLLLAPRQPGRAAGLQVD